MPPSVPRRLAALAGIVSLAAGLLALATAPAAGAESRVELFGHGWGHGRGMGQYGSLGYSVDHGWSHRQIVDHFYGGTTAGSIPTDTQVGVRLLNHDGKSLTVKVAEGTLSSVPGGNAPDRALRIFVNPDDPSTFRLADARDCSGPFTVRPGSVSQAAVTVVPPAGVSGRNGILQHCEYHQDGSFAGVRWFRGTLALHRTEFGLRTVNGLGMEQYLRGVVPRESPASWADVGGGKGVHALRAQAVAARSYAAAEARYGYAQTCDTIACQVYLGHAHQPVGGAFQLLEDSRSDAAIEATAGEVRIRDGKPARTEFSSSTGGWTAGGVFPAVVDDGDGISANPNHRWTASIPFSTLEAKYGKGSLYSVQVDRRNGLGAEGGRVLAMRLRFSGGDVVLTGDEFRQAAALKSNWFSVRNLGPADSRTEPAGGWLLRADGTLQRFGAAPGLGPVSLPDDDARALSVNGPSGAGGYVVDGLGSLHPVGDAPGGVTPPRWSFDIARDLYVRDDGKSGWILDGYGALHGFGGAGKPPQENGAWANGADTSRFLLVNAKEDGGYTVKIDGTVRKWGTAPAVAAPSMPSGRTAVGATLHGSGRKGWVIDDTGAVHAFAPPGAKLPGGFAGIGAGVAHAAGRVDGRSGYYEGTGGGLKPFGGATQATLTTTIAADLSVVDIALAPEPAGYVVDAFGGLHPFGGAPRVTRQPYWPGGNVARKVVAFEAGGGWIMDRHGQLYPFVTEAGGPPGLPWPGPKFGAPLARDISLIPGTNAGYVLDGWGGLHSFGGAPAATGQAYWPNWDIARGFGVNPSGTGGHVLDAWGAVHPFAIGGKPVPPGQKGSAYWPGWKIVRDMVVTGENEGYTVDGWGGVHPFGGTGGKGSWWWDGQDLAVAAAGDGSHRDWIVYLDAWGGTHSGGVGSPLVTPSTTWPQWRVARDVTLIPS